MQLRRPTCLCNTSKELRLSALSTGASRSNRRASIASLRLGSNSNTDK